MHSHCLAPNAPQEIKDTMHVAAKKMLALAIGVAATTSLAHALIRDDDTGVRGPQPPVGPDLIAGRLANAFGDFDLSYYGFGGSINGFAMATQACNIGDEEAAWTAGTNAAPLISQNCYIYENGVFRQIGLSWLKHSFCALSESEAYCGTCVDNNDCDWLAAGCADTYFSGLNASANAPRTAVNPSTGTYTFPFPISPTGAFELRGKLQIQNNDSDPAAHPDARWVLGAYYMATDDAVWGNHMNNSSWREITFTTPTSAEAVGETTRMAPAMGAWEQMEPGGITIDTLDTPEDAGTGRVILGSKATDLGNGWWHYQYAVENLNSHRGIGRFTLPIPDCVSITNPTFTDVFYHSGEAVEGTNWTRTQNQTTLAWHTDAYEDNELANAIRWNTLYTFGFDTQTPPVPGTALLGLWRPGSPDSITGSIVVPSDGCSNICDADVNEDGLVNVNDLLIIIGLWGQIGSSYADISGDQLVGVVDLLMVLDGWGQCG